MSLQMRFMMESLKDFLIKTGFGKTEVEVYQALLSMGTSSVLNISKKTKIHRSNIYDALRSLVNNGLVYEIDTDTKKFHARPIKSLLHYFENRKAELEEMIEEYEKRNVIQEQPKEKIKLSKGIFSLREVLFKMIDMGDEILVYGIPREAPLKLGPIIKEFHKKRIEKEINMRHIYNSNAKDRVMDLNKMEFTEAKILSEKFDSDVTTNICGDYVFIFFWNEPMALEIHDKNLANHYKKYFEVIWKKAKV